MERRTEKKDRSWPCTRRKAWVSCTGRADGRSGYVNSQLGNALVERAQSRPRNNDPDDNSHPTSCIISKASGASQRANYCSTNAEGLGKGRKCLGKTSRLRTRFAKQSNQRQSRIGSRWRLTNCGIKPPDSTSR